MVKSFLIHLLSAIIYYSGLIRIIRFFGSRYAKIIIYHSINENESNFTRGTNTCVSPLVFEKHLNYLGKYYQFISLEKLVESLKQDRIPPHSVVVTFDDGFADNFHFAYAYLKGHKIVATIFLAIDCIDNKKPIWIQELYYLMNTYGVEKILKKLNNFMNGKKINDLVLQSTSNISISKKVEEYMAYSLTKGERDKILSKLYKAFAIPREEIFKKKNIFLTWNQIKQMYRDGISFGNHGESHTPFSAMSSDEQEKEIVNSKNVIDKNLGIRFVPFAYPYGQPRDFSSDTKEIIIRTEHSCILTSMPSLIYVDTSPFELGRINVTNIPVSRFAFEIEKSTLKYFLSKFFIYKVT
jgi:peptidoglycan/xylan/chitin deacetylase (PgdA/CDA1 family)